MRAFLEGTRTKKINGTCSPVIAAGRWEQGSSDDRFWKVCFPGEFQENQTPEHRLSEELFPQETSNAPSFPSRANRLKHFSGLASSVPMLSHALSLSIQSLPRTQVKTPPLNFYSAYSRPRPLFQTQGELSCRGPRMLGGELALVVPRRDRLPLAQSRSIPPPHLSHVTLTVSIFA